MDNPPAIAFDSEALRADVLGPFVHYLAGVVDNFNAGTANLTPILVSGLPLGSMDRQVVESVNGGLGTLKDVLTELLKLPSLDMDNIKALSALLTAVDAQTTDASDFSDTTTHHPA